MDVSTALGRNMSLLTSNRSRHMMVAKKTSENPWCLRSPCRKLDRASPYALTASQAGASPLIPRARIDNESALAADERTSSSFPLRVRSGRTSTHEPQIRGGDGSREFVLMYSSGQKFCTSKDIISARGQLNVAGTELGWGDLRWCVLHVLLEVPVNVGLTRDAREDDDFVLSGTNTKPCSYPGQQ